MQPSSDAQLLSGGHKVKPDTGAMASSGQPAMEARPRLNLVEYGEMKWTVKTRRGGAFCVFKHRSLEK
jgi:hypothetical protein